MCYCVHSANSVFNGTKSIRFLCPDISNVTLNEMKHLENRGDFKIAIKKCNPISPSRRLWKTYLDGFGYRQTFLHSCQVSGIRRETHGKLLDSTTHAGNEKIALISRIN